MGVGVGGGGGAISHKTSYRKISQSLEGAISGVKIVVSLWNLASGSAAILPRRLQNFRRIRKL